MIKIGFIDYYLDEWHANNYPAWMRSIAKEQGWDIDICYAYGQMDKQGGLTTEDWCKRQEIEPCPTLEALVEKSDAILVLSPDNSEQHERLGNLALRSGKPVYMDKTFSPDLASGIRMFDLAEQHGTPLCSSSALRYAKALIPNWRNEQVNAVVTTGPGSLETYAVHQLEMIVSVLGDAPKKVLLQETGAARQLLVDYGEQKACMVQMPSQAFTVLLAKADGSGETLPCEAFFDRLMLEILSFFQTRKPLVSRKETLAVMALLEAAQSAQRKPGEWVRVNPER